MKLILNYLSKFKIKKQFVIGFSILIIILIGQALVTISSITHISNITAKTVSLTDVTEKILIIEKNISEIQRLALAYTRSGKDTLIKQMKSHQKETVDLIKKVKDEIIIEEKKKLIIKMENIINSYDEHISELERLYLIKQNHLNDKLPTVLNEGVRYLENITEKNKILVLQTKNALLVMNGMANGFIKTRNYKLKINFKKIMKELKNSSVNKKELKGFDGVLDKYNSTFNKTIQANRMFLTLLNVVIAGDTVEISILAKKLKTISLDSLDRIQLESQEIIGQTNFYSGMSLLLTLVLVLFTIYVFNRNIANSLNDITQTIFDYIDGQFDTEIPGLERKDEIGLLAKAANSFKQQGVELIETKNDALRAKKIKSEFLANMSHEIRTPMNGILGMVSILEETKMTDEQLNMLKTISSSGNSLLTVLNDILDFSKLESGKFTIENRAFNLVDCLNEIEFMFSNAVNSKGIKFHYFVDEAVPLWISSDITRLKQIIINLCSNAIKFTSKGEIYIKVYLKDEKLCFDVVDTGIGIKQEALKTLFEAFTQADTSITRKYGGTGLGLTISAKLASLMGGMLSAESDFGKGSTFKLQVKYEVAEEEHAQNVANNHQDDRDLFPQFRILVAEDNKVNIAVLTRMFEKLNVSYEHAWNGEEAVQLAKEQEFDLIFMDMQMPKMDGIEATKAIRKFDSIVPVFALTANVLNEDREKCILAGMNEFITKPIKLPDLKEFLLKASREYKIHSENKSA